MPEQNRSWLRLTVFCLTAALSFALVVATIFAGATLAFGRSLQDESNGDLPNPSTTVAYSGVITDTRCGAKHSTKSDKNSAECARACVRHGARYALVDGDKMYFLIGNRGDFEQLAGQRTEVIGTLDGNELKVTSIKTQ